MNRYLKTIREIIATNDEIDSILDGTALLEKSGIIIEAVPCEIDGIDGVNPDRKYMQMVYSLHNDSIAPRPAANATEVFQILGPALFAAYSYEMRNARHAAATAEAKREAASDAYDEAVDDATTAEILRDEARAAYAKASYAAECKGQEYADANAAAESAESALATRAAEIMASLRDIASAE